ncbi:MAG: hypothetical protein ABIV04_00935 [Massilia sp.]
MIDDKLEQGVFKIFRMTHEDRLGWRCKPAPDRLRQASQSAWPLYFETEYQGRKLALFQGGGLRGEQCAPSGGAAPYDWRACAHLVLLGDNGELLFEFPWSRQVQDLFEAVRYKASKVGDFLDALLKPESAN